MNLFDVIEGMSNVRRWSHAYCHKEEFVIEHTAIVALVCLKIGKDLGADMGMLLEKALLHDMEEIVTGDVPTPTKYANKELTEEFHKYEKVAAKEVSSAFGSWAFISWEDSKDDTLEGQIVRLADMAAVVYKIRQELNLGNKFFDRFKENIWTALERQRLDRYTHEGLKKYVLDFQYYLLSGETNEYT